MHKPLAERAATDDGSAVVILHRTGEDLRGGGREVIDKHDQGHVFESPGTVCRSLITGVRTAFGVHDQLAAGEELIRHADGLLHIAAGVLPEIDDEGGGTLRLEVRESGDELLIGRLAELIDAHETDLVFRLLTSGFRLNNEFRIDGSDGDVSSGDGEVERFSHAGTQDA